MFRYDQHMSYVVTVHDRRKLSSEFVRSPYVCAIMNSMKYKWTGSEKDLTYVDHSPPLLLGSHPGHH